MDNIEYKKLENNEITQTKDLIMEYIKWLNMDLCFQNIDDELNNFPQKYKEPDGTFIIAKDNNLVVGCVGLRKIKNEICEIKRLFVKDKYKGKNIGKKLVEIIIEEGQNKGYKKMRLDTLNIMETAVAIYKKYGFYEIEPYTYNPEKGVIYLEKILW
ncbi:GNAT family N-acetyltransferase [Leadbettera azotonutricia]|uniref:Acetyltransferase, GNAT family n=1 Tax=Leadbettera azotonutricia (strain ATCC BAA-888 / DSM 13862 / ZAS-9) TaxID=545695 RepID=F5YEL6_LEAAZ|nr:GNAT family N-acetyltransferase [Leadbettera azotonutricia]AEF82545.1 acetyltransferase, GNAT family [Leadbettera azotonutricia ZAS-9]